MGRKCWYVEGWRCIVPSPEWSRAADAGYEGGFCVHCREARELAAELRQKDHILKTQVEAYKKGRKIRQMNQEMMRWSVEERHSKAEAKKLEAEGGG